MLNALEITRLQDQATLRWHQDKPWPDPLTLAQLKDAILRRPRAGPAAPARSPGYLKLSWNSCSPITAPTSTSGTRKTRPASPEPPTPRIAQVKRNIDALNQTRNDLVEAMDRALLAAAGRQNPAAPLHSESPGLILDRLSILALKIYHTAEETRRASATEAHRQRNRARLALLEEQRSDLAACLNALWNEVLDGKRRFKLYRQMKMYNDPELNPAVYAHKPKRKKAARRPVDLLAKCAYKTGSRPVDIVRLLPSILPSAGVFGGMPRNRSRIIAPNPSGPALASG